MVLRKPEILSSTEVEEHLWELVGSDLPEESRQMSQGGTPKSSKFSLEDRRKLTHELLAKAHETNAAPSHLGDGQDVVNYEKAMKPSVADRVAASIRRALKKPLEQKQLHC